MGAYLRKVKEELIKFKYYEILQIPRAENANADALSKLASSKGSDALGVVPIEELERPTIEVVAKALIIQTVCFTDEAIRHRYSDAWMMTKPIRSSEKFMKESAVEKARFRVHSAIPIAWNLTTFCDSLGIRKDFSVPIHPQSNGQVEAIKKILKYTLKKRLDNLKGKWAEELPKVLWAYRTTSRTTIGETPFSRAYGVEPILPVEIEMPTLRTVIHNDDDNTEGMNGELDLLKEKRLDSQLRLAAYQQRASRYYNKRVRQRRFIPRVLVLKMVTQSTNLKNTGPLSPTWEGPYRIREVSRPSTYILESLDGKRIQHPWNAEQLRLYYQ
ncbi:uncharacterized protein LOC112094642 [Morus notabilis]|uniref:uncharacterized protein LOC112094642 n=1 Tax=Morus notabilis TaxID=981085 RepID=UPI000CED260D|nr:uncharacterized protein LOC112094642 [Morus notabilis]